MFDRIAPRYDLMNRLMTFGVDRGWRRRAIAALALGPGARVLDLACGSGDLTAAAGGRRSLRRYGPRSRSLLYVTFITLSYQPRTRGLTRCLLT